MLYYFCTEVTLKRKFVKSVKDAGGEMLQSYAVRLGTIA